jgi:hypothetical protein
MSEIITEHLKSLTKEPPIKSGTPDPYSPKDKREADWNALKKALEALGL